MATRTSSHGHWLASVGTVTIILLAALAVGGAARADVQTGENGRLAFWYQPAGADCQSLATMAPDGTDLQIVVDCADNAVGIIKVAHVSWSPDAQQIAFMAEHADDGWQLYIVDADGATDPEVVLVDYGEGGMPTCSSWNHDWATDDVIWYSSNCDSQVIGRIDLAAGTGEEWLTDCNWTVNVSPDGTQLVTFGYDIGACTAPITDPTDQTTVASGNGQIYHTSWTTGGGLLWADDSDGVYRSDADGSNQALLVAEADARFPMMSPDGTKLSYILDNQIIVADADGSNPVDVFASLDITARAASVKWSVLATPPTTTTTTTTVAPTTTTTTVAPTTVAPTTAGPTTAAPTTIDPNSGGVLPETGSNSTMAVIALLAVALGSALAALARRARQV